VRQSKPMSKLTLIFLLSALFILPSTLGAGQKQGVKHKKHPLKPAAALKQPDARYGQYDFSLTMLDGSPRHLSSFGGKTVLVFVFTPECDPCSLQAAGMADLYSRYRQEGFEILGVAVHSGETAVRSFVNSAGISWPVGMRDDAASIFGAYGLPDSWLFLPNGALLKHFIGYSRPEMIEPFIRQAVNPPKKESR
jgi:peroxiredoxin